MKNLHLKIAWVYVLLMALLFQAQYIEAQKNVTFEQAIDMALNNRESLKSSEIAILMAQKELAAEKSGYLPDINASVNVQRNLIIPSTPVPLGVFQGSDNQNYTYIQFGTDWQSSVGFTFNYDIYNPEKKTQLISSEGNQRAAELNHLATQNSVKLATAKAYAEAVLTYQQYRYAIEDTLLNFQELKVAKDLQNNGRLTGSQLNEAYLQLNQSRSRYWEADKIYKQARIELGFQIGFDPQKDSLPIVADSLSVLLEKIEQMVSGTYIPYSSTGFLKLMSQHLQDSLSLKNSKKMAIPTLSLNAAYGSNYYENQFQPFNFNSWYGNSYVGITLQIPIMQDFKSHLQTKAAQLKLDQTRYDISEYSNRKQADIDKTLLDIKNYKQEMQQKLKDIQLAKQNLQESQDLFAKGRILPNDLNSTKLSYQNALVSQLQAVYNYCIASLNLINLLEN